MRGEARLAVGKYAPRKLRRSMQRGQTAVLALLVMLLLAFAGALFVTIVARNLVNAHRQNRVETADYYADAGIHYADDQLTNSVLGADWRPTPYSGVVVTNDPDAKYLTATPPFTRYNMGNGRFLLRLTYVEPAGYSGSGKTQAPISDPTTGYIKIEAIGREGIVDPQDPTTFGVNKQNVSLVAWKAIGITQYGLFVTNIDKRSDIAPVGVPSVYDSSSDVKTPGIITPGVADFITPNQLPTGFQPYPITTVLGAPDAYKVVSGQLQPNPNAGRYPITVDSSGKWLETVGGTQVQVAPGGGTMRANATTRFFGLNKVYLNSSAYDTYLQNLSTPLTGIDGMVLDEHIETAGDLLLDKYSPADATGNAKSLDVQDAALLLDPPPASMSNAAVYDAASHVAPSSAPPPSTPLAAVVNPNTGFDSKGGAIRDGESGNDIYGYPREVKRLDPPVIDNVISATGLTRYRDMAINSGSRNSSWGIPDSLAGKYGFGKIVYVDNTTDLQSESSVAGAGYSLVDEWLNRTQGASSTLKNRWNGGVYTPPAVEVNIGDLRQYGLTTTSSSGGTPPSVYGIYLLRHDVDAKGNPVTWKDPVNSTSTKLVDSGNPGLRVTYDELGASNATGTDPSTVTNPNNDVIIVCEGNVRVHGIVSADAGDNSVNPIDRYPRHITIVTYGTAYIDGNLLRGIPDSSIAVLAHDYVCVNTTQFTAGKVVDGEPTGKNPPAGALDTAGALDFGDNSGLSEEFSFGLPQLSSGADTPANEYSGVSTAQNNQLALYVVGQAGATSGSAGSTQGTAQLDFNIYNRRVNLTGGTQTGPQLLHTFTFGPAQSSDPSQPGNPTMLTYPIGQSTYTELTNPNGTTTASQTLTALVESQPLHLWMTKNPASTADPELSRVVILPMDIRIEAVLYAQTRSFFVIPGDSFNPQATDTVDKYATQQTLGSTTVPAFTARGGGIDNSDANQARFPFYGQPIDLKVTIYGAVSEAHPADIGAQADWMKKWGWIPQYHGSLTGFSTTPDPATPTPEWSGHKNPDWTATNQVPGVGLSIVYDPQCGYPVATGSGAYLRVDAYKNPLPFAPRLPVCPGLIYAGQTPQLPSS